MRIENVRGEPVGYVSPYQLEALLSGRAGGITLEDKPDAHNRVTMPLYTAQQRGWGMTTNDSEKQPIWVVTRSINEYDQDGDYFVGFFYEKPTPEQLAILTGRTIEYWQESPEGGRHGLEDEWYHVVQMKEGGIYDSQ